MFFKRAEATQEKSKSAYKTRLTFFKRAEATQELIKSTLLDPTKFLTSPLQLKIKARPIHIKNKQITKDQETS